MNSVPSAKLRKAAPSSTHVMVILVDLSFATLGMVLNYLELSLGGKLTAHEVFTWKLNDGLKFTISGYPGIYAAVNERETHDWIQSIIQSGVTNAETWTQWTEWTECMCHDDQTSGKRTRKKTCTLKAKWVWLLKIFQADVHNSRVVPWSSFRILNGNQVIRGNQMLKSYESKLGYCFNLFQNSSKVWKFQTSSYIRVPHWSEKIEHRMADIWLTWYEWKTQLADLKCFTLMWYPLWSQNHYSFQQPIGSQWHNP